MVIVFQFAQRMPYNTIMEVELRAKVRNRATLRNLILKLGAKFVKKRKLEDYYFGNINLYEQLSHSFWVRLRKEQERVELTYKGPTSKDGVYEEYSQIVQDLETAISILEKSGLENPISIIKERESFEFGKIKIEIDEFQDRGTFLELEIISNDYDKSELFDLMKKLGIDSADIFEKGYITLFLSKINSPYSKWIIN